MAGLEQRARRVDGDDQGHGAAREAAVDLGAAAPRRRGDEGAGVEGRRLVAGAQARGERAAEVRGRGLHDRRLRGPRAHARVVVPRARDVAARLQRHAVGAARAGGPLARGAPDRGDDAAPPVAAEPPLVVADEDVDGVADGEAERPVVLDVGRGLPGVRAPVGLWAQGLDEAVEAAKEARALAVAVRVGVREFVPLAVVAHRRRWSPGDLGARPAGANDARR